MAKLRIYTTSVASVYVHYVAKAEKEARTDCETFFEQAPGLNPSSTLITGSVCGVRLDEIDDPLMREIRYLGKLIDELARGRPMEKILRTG